MQWVQDGTPGVCSGLVAGLHGPQAPCWGSRKGQGAGMGCSTMLLGKFWGRPVVLTWEPGAGAGPGALLAMDDSV